MQLTEEDPGICVRGPSPLPSCLLPSVANHSPTRSVSSRPSPPLPVRSSVPLKPVKGLWERCKVPQRSGAEPRPKANLVHSEAVRKPLVAIIAARCYARAVLAMGPYPCLSVCVSVTSRCSTKTAKHRITQTKPHDSSGTLDLREIRPGSPATGTPNAGGVGQNR